MTLFKQINSLFFVLFLLVMMTLVYFQFYQAREFMHDKMASDVNNTTLALVPALQIFAETGDIAFANSAITGIFKGGFYRKVTLTWTADSSKEVWENDIEVEGVSPSFIDLDLFGEYVEKIDIVSTSMQTLATLEVEAHPGHGYKQLWQVMSDTIILSSLLFLIGIFTLRYRLNTILRPLYKITKQAEEISQRKFGESIPTPNTTELKSVVAAFNSMSGQLKQVFSSLDKEVSELKEDKLIDQVSQLPNRQYLSAQIYNFLAEPGYGGLILGKFEWLEDVYSKYGYQGRDEIIKTLSKRMQAELPSIAEGVIARISNTDFAFLLQKAEKKQIETYLHTLIRIVNQEITKAGCPANTKFALGVCERIDHMKASDLMSQADNALQQAWQENKVSHWIDAQQTQKFSREQWRAKLEASISTSQFTFKWQGVSNMQSNALIHKEVYCRLNIDGQVISAAEFMPFVELLSLGSQLDKCLLYEIEARDLAGLSSSPIAINLTHESIQDPSFASWLRDFLTRSTHADQMIFEIPESVLIASFETCSILAENIRAAGAKIGIDHCGRQMGTLDYLPKLQPHYIKLDPSYAFYEKVSQSNELCRAIISVAKGLNIDVIITGIEDTEQLENFMNLRADGYQGYILPPQDV